MDYSQQQQQNGTIPEKPQMAYSSPNQMNNQQPVTSHEAANYNHINKPPGSWSFGLFDCFAPFSLCCLSFWCPCYVFGKTHSRNKTGEKDPSGFNGMCAAYCGLLYCGCVPILQCITRENTRTKHNIDGNMFSDFCVACCCSCCALIQEEKESIVRETGVDPKTGLIYQPVGSMTFNA